MITIYAPEGVFHGTHELETVTGILASFVYVYVNMMKFTYTNFATVPISLSFLVRNFPHNRPHSGSIIPSRHYKVLLLRFEIPREILIIRILIFSQHFL